MLRVLETWKASVISTVVSVFAVAAVGTEPRATTSAPQTAPASTTRVTGFGRLPLTFERNTGHYDKQVKFLARTGGATVFLTADEMVMVLPGKARGKGQEARGAANIPSPRLRGEPATNIPSPRSRGEGQGEGRRSLSAPGSQLSAASRHVLRMKLVGANAKAVATGLEKQQGIVNYFIGNDRKKWRTRVPTYARAKLTGVYPGVDVVYYGTEPRAKGQDAGPGGRGSLSALGSQLSALEYDFIIKPGADPRRIKLAFEGADRIRVAGGDLILSTPAGDVRMKRPYAYQTIGGKRVQVACDYRLTGRDATLRVARYDATRALVVDPVLEYSTLLGSYWDDNAYGIAVDSSGAAYVTGSTNDWTFPTTPGAFDRTHNGFYNGERDAFVTKLNPSGSALVYSTFLGGGSHEEGYYIAVDSSGAAYVTGCTGSPDFPTTPGAFDTSLNGEYDAFVTKLNPSGSALVYSSFVGGSLGELGIAVGVDAAGAAYVTGQTGSADFPTTQGAFCTTLNGWPDAFVTKLNPSGSALVYSTLLGGSEHHEMGTSIATGAPGSVYLSGWTYSGDFPTTPGAFQPGPGRTGFANAFVTKLNLSFPTAASLVLHRANLHTHSGYSDGGWLDGGNDPLEAYRKGHHGGLDVMAVTDHAEQITDIEWGASISMAHEAMDGGFVALPGFEWTHTFNDGTGAGHVNVLGTSTRVGAYVQDIPQQDVRSTLASFYAWLALDASAIDGGSVVAQFNHPSAYDASDYWAWASDPLGFPADPALRQAVRNAFALMEVGSHVLIVRWDGTPDVVRYEGTASDNGSGDPDKDNEYWFRRALNNGWRVAPTNNGDNHRGNYAFGTNPPVYTGIFAAPLPAGSTAHQRQSHILNALRARRTFASEDRDAQVIMTADAGLASQPWWMGTWFGLPPGASLTLRVQAQDQSDPIAKVELIRIPGETLYVWNDVNGNFFDQSYSLTTADMGSWPVTPYGEAWVYAKVTESDGQLLYSAPVWIALPGSHSVVTAPPVSGGAFSTLRSWLRRITGGRADEPLVGKEVLFRVEGAPVGKAITDSNGEAALLYVVPEGETTLHFTAEFAGDADAGASYGENVLTVSGEATTLYTIDRTGTITEPVILWGYLKRTSDGAKLDGKTVEFRIDGTAVGSAVTGATGSSGRADLNWVITEGPETRTILAEFAGDAEYLPSSGTATLTAQTWPTKMSGVDREGKITAYRILKAWLWKMDSTPVVGKSIAFYLDGTLLGTNNTRTTGLAQIGYTIADGAGAGARTIYAEWAGDGGYLPSSCTNTLNVLKATPYIWVMPRSVPQGGIARLYAYFRRLADYQKQEGKTVTFRVDGTWVADVVTLSGAEAGIARYQYPTVEPPGVHTIRCEFAGDAWVEAGYGEANLTIY